MAALSSPETRYIPPALVLTSPPSRAQEASPSSDGSGGWRCCGGVLPKPTVSSVLRNTCILARQLTPLPPHLFHRHSFQRKPQRRQLAQLAGRRCGCRGLSKHRAKVRGLTPGRVFFDPAPHMPNPMHLTMQPFSFLSNFSTSPPGLHSHLLPPESPLSHRHSVRRPLFLLETSKNE